MGAVRALFGILCALGLIAVGPGGAEAARIWLAGGGASFRNDYFAMFRPDAPWKQAAAKVSVFKISTQMALGTDRAALTGLIQDLRRRHIGLAMEALMLPKPDGCGGGVEGYSNPGEIERSAMRIKSLGGTLDAVAMDEPVTFGHHYTGREACRSALTDLATQVAGQVAAIRRVFPDVVVGDIEFVGGPDLSVWTDDLLSWLDAYKKAAAEPLGFMHLDIDWHTVSAAQVQVLTKRLHAAGTKVGIIYNGDPDDHSGIAWTRHAEERFAAVEQDPAAVPDDAVLHTWMDQPAHMLPESDPGTMTGLVLRYAATPTALVLRREGRQLTGRLMAPNNQPVSGAHLDIDGTENAAYRRMGRRTLAATIAAGATNATIALRLDTECGCGAPVDATFGRLMFQDDDTGERSEHRFPGTTNGADRRVTADQAHPVMLDTPRFPVAPGHPFTLAVDLSITAESRDGGYLAVIFLRADGSEVGRRKMTLEPGTASIGEAETGPDGGFAFRLPFGVTGGAPNVSVRFDGDARHRLAVAHLPAEGR